MTKQEITLAIRTCKHVYATVHLTEDDTFILRVVKSDLLDKLDMRDSAYCNSFKAWIGENGNLYIG